MKKSWRKMKLVPTIIVDITSDYFEFTEGDFQIRLETCLNYTIEEGIFKPVTIGQNIKISGTNFVRLFDPDFQNNLAINKMDFLEWFLEYAIGKIFEKRFFPALKPLVIYRGAEKLDKILCGYQRGVLEIAALLANARTVRFE